MTRSRFSHWAGIIISVSVAAGSVYAATMAKIGTNAEKLAAQEALLTEIKDDVKFLRRHFEKRGLEK